MLHQHSISIEQIQCYEHRGVPFISDRNARLIRTDAVHHYVELIHSSDPNMDVSPPFRE